MGGGAAMRAAAAKIAGMGSGLRSGPAVHAASQSVRNASCGGRVPSIELASGDVAPATVQLSAWEVDDWDFAGFEDEKASEPMSRVVFGDVPSYEEAKSATSDLKEAIDKVYLSSRNTAGYGEQIPEGQVSALPLLSNSMETQSSIIGGAIAAYPVSKHAAQAFTLFSQSPAAQSVVASLASDPNVWNAFLQNEAVKDFLQSESSSIQLPSAEPKAEESVEDTPSDVWKSPKLEELSAVNHENGLMEILKNVKLTIEEMVSNVSSFLGNIFSSPATEKTSAANNGNAGSTFNEKALGASFMGLAVLAILVVLLKRV